MMNGNVRSNSKQKEGRDMPRFFVKMTDISENVVTLRGDAAHHIAYALRLAAGEHITVCDGQLAYDCQLTSFSPDKSHPWVKAVVIDSQPIDTEPPYVVRLYQALPKGDKLDIIIQKSVECGVYEVIPFESSRCVVHAKQEAEARKSERRNRIAEEAAKQCGRGMIPLVKPTMTYAQMLTHASTADVVLFCYEADGTQPLGQVLHEKLPTLTRAQGKVTEIAVIVGSEGGFSPEEAEQAASQGFCMIGLGKRILRCETAPIFVLSCLSYQYELS